MQKMQEMEITEMSAENHKENFQEDVYKRQV